MRNILLSSFLLFVLGACGMPLNISEKNLHPGGFRSRHTWNILVYMNADNDLYTNSIADMNEMENVPLDSGVTILVLWDGNGAKIGRAHV